MNPMNVNVNVFGEAAALSPKPCSDLLCEFYCVSVLLQYVRNINITECSCIL